MAEGLCDSYLDVIMSVSVRPLYFPKTLPLSLVLTRPLFLEQIEVSDKNSVHQGCEPVHHISVVWGSGVVW